MSILKYIESDNFHISEDKDLVFTDNQKGGAVSLTHNRKLVDSIELTDGIIKDACFLKRAEFDKKYQGKLKEDAKLNAKQIYKLLRTIIVDDKVPIPRDKQNSPKPKEGGSKDSNKKKSKTIVPKKGSRKEQVRYLLDSGVTSPKEIANELGTNVAYVYRLIKQVQDGK